MGRDRTCLALQKTMSGPGKSYRPASPPGLPHFSVPGLVRLGRAGAWRLHLASVEDKSQKSGPKWLKLDPAQLNWAWKTLSDQRSSLPALGQTPRGWERPDRQGLCPWELRL